MGHSCDLFVNLLGIVNAEILRDGHDWTLWIGTTPLVPVGTRRAELRRTQDVDAAVVAQQQILQKWTENLLEENSRSGEEAFVGEEEKAINGSIRIKAGYRPLHPR